MNPYHSYKDEELMTGANQADFGAYEELVHRKTAELYRISSALTREHVRAEQLLQHTISAVWHKCSKKRDQEMDVSLLLMQTLLIQNKKRPGRGEQKLSSMEPRDAEESSSESLPVKQMTNQRSRQIEQAIGRMPTAVRQVFLLTYMAEIDSSEIALYIGKNEQVVARRLQQAMTILVRELGENSGDIHPTLLRKHFGEEREQEEIDLHTGRGAAAVQRGLEDAREGRGSNRHSKRMVYR